MASLLRTSSRFKKNREYGFYNMWAWFQQKRSGGVRCSAKLCKEVVEAVALQGMSTRYLCTIVDGMKVKLGDFEHTFSVEVQYRFSMSLSVYTSYYA